MIAETVEAQPIAFDERFFLDCGLRFKVAAEHERMLLFTERAL